MEENLNQLLLGLECDLKLKKHLYSPEAYFAVGHAIASSANTYKKALEVIKKCESKGQARRIAIQALS